MTKQQSLTMGKTQRMVGLAIFTAIIIVLQLVSTFIKFGPFSITLAMIPIVVGAAVYGAGAGAYLGGVFSVVVLICCVTGADPGGAVVWNANPFLCIVVCQGHSRRPRGRTGLPPHRSQKRAGRHRRSGCSKPHSKHGYFLSGTGAVLPPCASLLDRRNRRALQYHRRPAGSQFLSRAWR